MLWRLEQLLGRAFLDDAPPIKAKGKGKDSAARALIPLSAVRDDGGQKIVFLVSQQKLERRAVNLGANRGNDVEVMAGISPGDMLVVRGGADLRNGQAVDIKQ